MVTYFSWYFDQGKHVLVVVVVIIVIIIIIIIIIITIIIITYVCMYVRASMCVWELVF